MIRNIVLSVLLLLPVAISAQVQKPRPVVGKGVIFFGPSVAESDTLDAASANMLGEFSKYTAKIAEYLQKQKIVFKYLSDRTIEVEYATVKHLTICRDTLMFGTILTDGKHPPTLLPYVQTDEELKADIREYFDIK